MKGVIHCTEASRGQLAALRPAPERREGLGEHEKGQRRVGGAGPGAEPGHQPRARGGNVRVVGVEVTQSSESPGAPGPDGTQGRAFQLETGVAARTEVRKHDGFKAAGGLTRPWGQGSGASRGSPGQRAPLFPNISTQGFRPHGVLENTNCQRRPPARDTVPCAVVRAISHPGSHYRHVVLSGRDSGGLRN